MRTYLKSACKIIKKMSLKNEFSEIEYAVKPLMPQHIADQKVDLILHDFPRLQSVAGLRDLVTQLAY